LLHLGQTITEASSAFVGAALRERTLAGEHSQRLF
jgi:hypothetical protein